MKITLVDLIDESFTEYKLPHMLVAFPKCSFKCDYENGSRVCQNWELAKAPRITVEAEDVAARYVSNDLTKAIVFAGLEPFDSYDDMYDLIIHLRRVTQDPIIIYTGYEPEEIHHNITSWHGYTNIIIKFGRYRPGQQKHFDEVLGVELASDNQFAERIC
jgi:pyruvate-formate lyase-activating enzyme